MGSRPGDDHGAGLLLAAEQAARDIVRECFDQIATNIIAVQRLDVPEGPHQLRVGLRRLRSAFSVFASVLASPELTRLGGEARWLGQEIGRLRDLEVVAGEIVRREAGLHPDEPGLGLLADALLALTGGDRLEDVTARLALHRERVRRYPRGA